MGFLLHQIFPTSWKPLRHGESVLPHFWKILVISRAIHPPRQRQVPRGLFPRKLSTRLPFHGVLLFRSEEWPWHGGHADGHLSPHDPARDLFRTHLTRYAFRLLRVSRVATMFFFRICYDPRRRIHIWRHGVAWRHIRQICIFLFWNPGRILIFLLKL